MVWVSRLPILWQTLLLLLGTLIVSVGTNVLVIMALPMPRMDFYAMRDIAEALANPDHRTGPAGDRLISLSETTAPPSPSAPGMPGNMISNARLSAHFAARLGTPVSRVRLIYQASQGNWPFRTGHTDAGVPVRLGEPQFYNTAIGAMQLDNGRWRVVRTPDRPFISRWQQRALAAFFLAFVAVLPFAYLFARHLALPIRRFADAAERVGKDSDAPAVPLEGSTELQLAARALTKMQVRLGETLAERTAMIGAIAHDLRTPLARIAFRIESAPAPVRDAVFSDIEQMRAMVSATISFVARGTEVGERQRVDLRQILERIVADAQAMQQKVELSGGGGCVIGDSVALERLIQNVVDNAVNYAGSAEINLDSRDGRTTLTVADRGPGVNEAMLESVFKPFNRGEPSRNRATGGVGLGLAIGRSIALAHAGTLTAANRSGGGLLVTAEFPAA